MLDTAIKVEGLSKRYRLGVRRRYKTIRESISSAASAPFKKLARRQESNSEDSFWALRDVAFEVNRGDVIGIIGRNGAGKSTLLKILSRITEPTEGQIEITGRVGSLLEVGTGFHPELTGRENIYLNGAILGMRRGEIVRKFDEIVAFAETEKFLDTPVKHYSSGMYTRLAFAVAAHLEPEILVVDEVLAVGDAAFQKKCLGKMGDVAREGRTVLFVSHNMAAIRSLCTRGIMLEKGRIVTQGEIGHVLQSYEQSTLPAEEFLLAERKDRSGDGQARLTSVKIESDDSDKTIHVGSRLRITLDYEGNAPLNNANVLIGIYDLSNVGLFLLDSDATGGLPGSLPAKGRIICRTDPISVTPGRCYLNLALQHSGVMSDYVQYAAVLDVESWDVYGTGKLPGRDWVMFVLGQKWSIG